MHRGGGGGGGYGRRNGAVLAAEATSRGNGKLKRGWVSRCDQRFICLIFLALPEGMGDL